MNDNEMTRVLAQGQVRSHMSAKRLERGEKAGQRCVSDAASREDGNHT